MEVYFTSKKLQKYLSTHTEIIKRYGQQNGIRIEQRLTQLKAANNLEQMNSIPGARLHPLKGNRKGEYAIDVIHPFRIVLKPYCDELPLRNDNEVDLSKIFAVTILEIVDYH